MVEPQVRDVLLELEDERRAIAKDLVNGSLVLCLGLIVVATGMIVPVVRIAGLLTGIAVAATGVWFLVRARGKRADYVYHFKRKALQAALRGIDASLIIEPEKGLAEYEFKFSQLFTKEPDRMSSEDQVSGRIGKTSFEFSEVHAEYKTVSHTKNGTRETWHDIFEGIIFVADFNKLFQGTTVVRPRDTGSAVKAWFAKHLPVFSSSEDLLVELENPEFCKEFVTWSSDQVEARYLLTPRMMERLCQLNEKSPETISVSFTGNYLYLAFPVGAGHFEPPLFKTLLRDDLLAADLEIVRVMVGIVEELDLNTRIWGKD